MPGVRDSAEPVDGRGVARGEGLEDFLPHYFRGGGDRSSFRLVLEGEALAGADSGLPQHGLVGEPGLDSVARVGEDLAEGVGVVLPTLGYEYAYKS